MLSGLYSWVEGPSGLKLWFILSLEAIISLMHFHLKSFHIGLPLLYKSFLGAFSRRLMGIKLDIFKC